MLKATGDLDVACQNDQPEDLSLEVIDEEPEETPNPDRNRAKRRAQLKKRQEAEAKQNRLPDDPFQWIGMKLIRKRDSAIFTVRTVFKNQRVELQKKWMSYTSDVQTIRAGYDPYF